jgi:hypothetical protein
MICERPCGLWGEVYTPFIRLHDAKRPVFHLARPRRFVPVGCGGRCVGRVLRSTGNTKCVPIGS